MLTIIRFVKSKILKLSLFLWLIGLPIMVLANEVDRGLRGSRLPGLFPTSGLGGSRTLTELVYNAVRILLTFAGAVAILFVVIGGFWYITAEGNEERSEKGKKTLVNAIIGIVVVILSYAIITAIANLVGYGSGVLG